MRNARFRDVKIFFFSPLLLVLRKKLRTMRKKTATTTELRNVYSRPGFTLSQKFIGEREKEEKKEFTRERAREVGKCFELACGWKKNTYF